MRCQILLNLDPKIGLPIKNGDKQQIETTNKQNKEKKDTAETPCQIKDEADN